MTSPKIRAPPTATNVKRQCFVIMPFSTITGLATEKEWTQIFDNLIKPAVQDAGLNYSCKRSEPIRGNIIAGIVQNLATAHIVIADLSGKNANVFYELGVRHALIGKTILLAQQKKDIPSDLQNYAYHIYDFRTEEGRKELRTTLRDLLRKLDREPHRPDNPVEDFVVHTPDSELAWKLGKFNTQLQKDAAESEIRRHIDTLKLVHDGKIPLRLHAAGYFRYFLDTINANTEQETVKVFARLINLEVRKKLREFGFKDLFPGLKDAVEAGKVEMEYLVFLHSRSSVEDSDTRSILDTYASFSCEVSLVFEDEHSVSADDTRETFVLLEAHRWVFTHGWEYSGELLEPFHWIKPEDFHSFSERFRRIKLHSQNYATAKK